MAKPCGFSLVYLLRTWEANLRTEGCTPFLSTMTTCVCPFSFCYCEAYGLSLEILSLRGRGEHCNLPSVHPCAKATLRVILFF
jgi:hypothetical protein